VVGWTTQDVSQGDNSYITFNVDGAGVAGLMPFPHGMKGHPGWNGYIEVDDVDAAAQKIKEQGGVIHRGPIDVPGTITFAVVADPQGAAGDLDRAGGGADQPGAGPREARLAGAVLAADGVDAVAAESERNVPQRHKVAEADGQSATGQRRRVGGHDRLPGPQSLVSKGTFREPWMISCFAASTAGQAALARIT